MNDKTTNNPDSPKTNSESDVKGYTINVGSTLGGEDLSDPASTVDPMPFPAPAEKPKIDAVTGTVPPKVEK